MGREERLSPPSQPDQIDSLFTQFDRASGLKKKESLAHEIARCATEDHYDCLTVLKTLNVGLGLAVSDEKREKQLGNIILNDVNGYFLQHGIVYKYLVPESSDPAKSKREIERESTLIQGRMKNAQRLRLTLLPIIEEMSNIAERSLSLISDDQLSIAAPQIIVGREMFNALDSKMYYHVKKAYQDVMGQIQTAANSEDLDPIHLRTPEKVLEAAKKASESKPVSTSFIPAPELPDIFTREFNGISLAHLSQIEDREAFGKICLRYLTALPKGDVFWREITNAVFLPTFVPYPGGVNASFFHNLEFSRKILDFELWLTEKLLIPAIEEATPDPEFDQLFGNFLSRLTPRQAAELFAVRLYPTAIYPQIIYQLFHPEADSLQAFANTQLGTAVLSIYRGDRRIVLSDQLINEIVVTNADRIHKNWSVRFYGNPSLTWFLHGLDRVSQFDFTRMHTETVIDLMRQSLGENFLEKFNERREELKRVTSLVYQNILAREEIAFWPSSQALHEVKFDEKSLPEIMGFDSITFRPNQSIEEPVEFSLLMKDSQVSITGQIFPNGEVGDLSIDTEEQFPGLTTLLEHIAIVTFHDLLLRREVVRKRKIISGKQLIVPSDRTAAERPTRSKSRRGERRGLPRTLIIEPPDFEYLDDVPQTSVKEMVETIHSDKEVAPRPPVIIDQHKTRVPFGRQYTNLIAVIRACDDPIRRGGLVERLATVRVLLTKPNEEKVKKLPSEFELLTIEDPVTHEWFTVDTWVVSYPKPKPTEEYLQSPEKMYMKYYHGGAASLFLDHVKTWIVE